MIKIKLDNYLIPFKIGCLMHVDPNLYIKCPPHITGTWTYTKSYMLFIFMVPNGLLVRTFKHQHFSQYFMHILLGAHWAL